MVNAVTYWCFRAEIHLRTNHNGCVAPKQFNLFTGSYRMPTMGDVGTTSAYDRHGRAQCDRTLS